MKKKAYTIVLICVTILALCLMTGCVPGDGTNSAADPAGFFSGVWHGWIAPIALIYSFFNSSTGIYETYNNGIAYNIGYYIAIISGFGSLAIFRGRNKD